MSWKKGLKKEGELLREKLAKKRSGEHKKKACLSAFNYYPPTRVGRRKNIAELVHWNPLKSRRSHVSCNHV